MRNETLACEARSADLGSAQALWQENLTALAAAFADTSDSSSALVHRSTFRLQQTVPISWALPLLAYQGTRWIEILPLLGLPQRLPDWL
jgi:hypothetical protein